MSSLSSILKVLADGGERIAFTHRRAFSTDSESNAVLASANTYHDSLKPATLLNLRKVPCRIGIGQHRHVSKRARIRQPLTCVNEGECGVTFVFDSFVRARSSETYPLTIGREPLAARTCSHDHNPLHRLCHI